MRQQLERCLGLMREVEIMGQKMSECSCCGRRASVSYVMEPCGKIFCITCGKIERKCDCVISELENISGLKTTYQSTTLTTPCCGKVVMEE